MQRNYLSRTISLRDSVELGWRPSCSLPCRWMFSFMTPIVSKARRADITLEDCLLPPDQTAEGESWLLRSEPRNRPSLRSRLPSHPSSHSGLRPFRQQMGCGTEEGVSACLLYYACCPLGCQLDAMPPLNPAPPLPVLLPPGTPSCAPF